MKLQRCANGRFYDGDKYPTCPHCQDAGLPGFKGDEEKTIGILPPIINNKIKSPASAGAGSEQNGPCVGWMVCIGGA